MADLLTGQTLAGPLRQQAEQQNAEGVNLAWEATLTACPAVRCPCHQQIRIVTPLRPCFSLLVKRRRSLGRAFFPFSHRPPPKMAQTWDQNTDRNFLNSDVQLSHNRKGPKRMASLMELKEVFHNADAVCFDVDSTVIREEGIDELAKFCGVGDAVAEMYVFPIALPVAWPRPLPEKQGVCVCVRVTAAGQGACESWWSVYFSFQDLSISQKCPGRSFS